jgi:hypothetical protein
MVTPHSDTYMNTNKKLYDMNDTYLIEEALRCQTFSTFVAWTVWDER